MSTPRWLKGTLTRTHTDSHTHLFNMASQRKDADPPGGGRDDIQDSDISLTFH